MALQSVGGTVNGRLTYANHNPDTGKYTDPNTGAVIPNFQPQPNYVQGAAALPQNLWSVPQPGGTTKLIEVHPGQTLPAGALSMSGQNAANAPTVPIYDENGRVIGYTGKGSVADATGAGAGGVAAAEAGGLTPKPGTTVVEQAQNAVSLQNMIHDNILPAMNDAIKANDMGPANGRVEEFLRAHVGNPNGTAAKLQAQLSAVPMMLGRMYGYRSAQYLQGMEDFLNTRMTPEALQGYLSGVSAHAATIAHQGGMGPKNAPVAETPTVGTVEGGYRFKGGDPAKQSNWEKQ